MNAVKIVEDAVTLFEAGMDADDFLKFIGSGNDDLMGWAKKNCPDFVPKQRLVTHNDPVLMNWSIKVPEKIYPIITGDLHDGFIINNQIGKSDDDQLHLSNNESAN